MKTKLLSKLFLPIGIGFIVLNASANSPIKANSSNVDVSTINEVQSNSSDFMKIESWMCDETLWKVKNDNALQTKTNTIQNSTQQTNAENTKNAKNASKSVNEHSKIKSETIMIESWMYNTGLWQIK